MTNTSTTDEELDKILQDYSPTTNTSEVARFRLAKQALLALIEQAYKKGYIEAEDAHAQITANMINKAVIEARLDELEQLIDPKNWELTQDLGTYFEVQKEYIDKRISVLKETS